MACANCSQPHRQGKSQRAIYDHLWQPTAAIGWYACAKCGRIAICAGCYGHPRLLPRWRASGMAIVINGCADHARGFDEDTHLYMQDREAVCLK